MGQGPDCLSSKKNLLRWCPKNAANKNAALCLQCILTLIPLCLKSLLAFMHTAQYTDYRFWLQNELTERCRRNPKYSLRSFSKFLGLNSSTLSQLISGKRRASVKLLSKLCDKLEISPLQKKKMAQFLEKQKKKNSIDSSIKKYPETAFQEVTPDIYAVMSEWYHYAILELTFTKKFQSNPSWIARSLGISSVQANIAIERLMRLGFLKKERGRFIKTSPPLTNFSKEITLPALRRLQEDILKLGLESLHNISITERDMSSMTMAIDTKKMPEAKKIITEFRRKLCKFLEDGKQTQVYHLGIQLYPVSKKEV